MSMTQIQQQCALSVVEEYDDLSPIVRLTSFITVVISNAACILSLLLVSIQSAERSEKKLMSINSSQIEKHVGAIIYGLGCLCSVVKIDMARASQSYLIERRNRVSKNTGQSS